MQPGAGAESTYPAVRRRWKSTRTSAAKIMRPKREYVGDEPGMLTKTEMTPNTMSPTNAHKATPELPPYSHEYADICILMR